MPDVGQQAPLFEGQTQDGDRIRLDAYRGRKVALYFYPKIDEEGVIRHVFKRPKVQEHTAEIMAAFEAVRA